MKKKVKRLLNFIDSKIFSGKMRKLYEKIKENRKKKFFNKKKSAVIEQAVADIILMQYNRNECMEYQFYDIGVRYLAIENYYKKNNVGFQLYKKMHTNGGNYGQSNKTEDYYNRMRNRHKTATYGKIREEHSIEQFEKLIRSYEENGYQNNSLIMCDRNLLNMNGSHRVALALYRNQEFINVEVHNLIFKRRFNIDWFWQNGFTNQEIKLLKDKTDAIINECHQNVGNFYCILYPPAENYFDEIVEDLKVIDDTNICVTGYKDYHVSVYEFVNYLYAIYSFDSITKKNLDRKIEFILSASNIVNNMVHYRSVSLDIKNPMYRLKSDNGKPESYATVKLKENIRSRYKNRDSRFNIHKKGYFDHDVIIHSTDNYLSNKAVRLLDNINYDLSDLFEKLKDIDYAIVESGIEKLSNQFPKKFYLTEDIDILIRERELEVAVQITAEFCKKAFCGDWFKCDVVKTEIGQRVRVYLKDCLIVMFDFMIIMQGLTPDYCEKALLNSQKDNLKYKYLAIEDELTFRMAKYLRNSDKIWHLEFIKKNADKMHINEKDFDDHKAINKIKKLIDY